MSTATKTVRTTTTRRTRKARVTSGPALMRWRKESGISRKLFAQMADCSERTLATYEKSLTLPATGLRTVNETVRLIHALHELAGDDVALTDWLKQPNPAFGKKTPLTLITTGESDVLWEMIHQIRQGSFA